MQDPRDMEALRAFLSECPPLSAKDEPPAHDPELVEMGFRKLTGDGSQPVHVIAQTVTRNEAFGPVLRIDFCDSEADRDYPLRAICWRKLDGEYGSLVCCPEDADLLEPSRSATA